MPTALITGASSGIGLELARLFAADKYNLVLVARRADKLEHLSQELTRQFGIKSTIFASDLSVPDASQDLFDKVIEADISIDVLVNNAGLGGSGEFASMPSERISQMIQVNMVALTQLTRLFLPSMIERGAGAILNVGSIAGYLPGPFMGVYYATKAYVLSFSHALSVELDRTGVWVTCVCPGATDTEFQEVAGVANAPLFKLRQPMTAAEVAKIGYEDFQKKNTVSITGTRNKLMTTLTRLVPLKSAAKLSARFNRKGHK